MRARILCALAVVLPMAAMAQAYKCKLTNGKTSFQDQPCEQGAKTEPLDLSDPSPAFLGAPAPSKGKAAPVKRDKLPHAQAGNADESLRDRNRQLEADNRAMRCTMARRNLAVLQAQRPAYSTDKNGKKQYVEDSNRQSEIAAAQQNASESCS